MAFIDLNTKEINCKIVYYGPAVTGKCTNLVQICNKYLNKKTNKYFEIINHRMVNDDDILCWFDFIYRPDINIANMKIRFCVCCLRGAVFYKSSREEVLKGLSGVVFVADSQPERMEANLECLFSLNDTLKANKENLFEMPYVLQLNKRDLPEIHSVETLTKKLRFKGEPVFEAVAYKGIGVHETFDEIANQIYAKLKNTDISKLPTKTY